MSSAATLKRPPELDDHHLGSFNASIMIVEYADFLCPFCAESSKVLVQILKKYKDVCLVYRHFPLTHTHPYAEVAAIASEASSKQGRFWDMHHALFKNQKDLSPETIFNIAREMRLDMRKFLNDLEDETLRKRVHQDFLSGTQNSIDSTPAVYMNGVIFEGDISVNGLSDEIDLILKEDQINI